MNDFETVKSTLEKVKQRYLNAEAEGAEFRREIAQLSCTLEALSRLEGRVHLTTKEYDALKDDLAWARSEARGWQAEAESRERRIAELEQRHGAAVAALRAAFIQRDGDVFYVTAGNIPEDVPERIARLVRAALEAE